MDPDLDDPNNHVPPVSPEDDWGDLDEDQRTLAPGQPSERQERGLPPRKEGRKQRVNHHAPKLKLHDDSSYSPLDPKPAAMRNEEEDLETPERPARKIARKTAKKAVKKAKDQTAKKKSRDSVPEPAQSAPAADAEKADDADHADEERIVLPPSQGNKRFRVNEIGPPRESGAQRVPKMYAPPATASDTPEKVAQGAAKARMRFSRGERSDWGEKTARGSLRWTAYSGIGIIALVIVAVVMNRPKPGEGGREQSMFSQLAPAESEVESGEEDGDMMAMLTAGQEEAKRIFARYATAKSTADFIGTIHRHEEIADVIERRWAPLGAGTGWKPAEQAVWTVLEQEGVRYGALEGGLPDFTTYRAFFRQEEGGLKMDWKATVAYCSADFVTLKKGQGDGGEVRAWLSPADFHTFPLPEGEFRSFRLASPDGQESLWGYAKAGGVLDGKLLAQFVPSQITGEAQSEIAVIVVLERGPTEALPNQWMITNLVRLNWLDE